MEGMFKLLSGRFPLPNPGGWMVGFERPSLCTEARTQPHGGKSAVENQADAMLQTPVQLKKLSTGQDSRCGVREREGILRAGNLSKNVQNKRPEGGA